MPAGVGKLVIADTGPVNYLILIGHIGLLPLLFQRVIFPAAVIALAESLHADLLLIDERKGVNIARRRGLRVTGTLGLLEMAAQGRLIDFAGAVERLRRTTFRSPEELLAAMLKKHESKGGDALPA